MTTLKQRVNDVIARAGKPLTAAQIARRIGVKPGSIGGTLSRMRAYREVVVSFRVRRVRVHLYQPIEEHHAPQLGTLTAAE